MTTVNYFVFFFIAVSIVNSIRPPAWPKQHSHVEIMYTPSDKSIKFKQIYYDFPGLRYYADESISGKMVLSSYWLKNTLYIYNWTDVTCVQLEMGFAMMTPDWFLTGSEEVAQPWLAKKSDKEDDEFHQTLWLRKSAGDPGYFDYFSDLNTGEPFRLTAPSQGPYVINEYYNFTVVDFSKGPLQHIFDRPEKPICTPHNGENQTMPFFPELFHSFNEE